MFAAKVHRAKLLSNPNDSASIEVEFLFRKMKPIMLALVLASLSSIVAAEETEGDCDGPYFDRHGMQVTYSTPTIGDDSRMCWERETLDLGTCDEPIDCPPESSDATGSEPSPEPEQSQEEPSEAEPSEDAEPAPPSNDDEP